jgi:hypothetical protein
MDQRSTSQKQICKQPYQKRSFSLAILILCLFVVSLACNMPTNTQKPQTPTNTSTIAKITATSRKATLTPTHAPPTAKPATNTPLATSTKRPTSTKLPTSTETVTAANPPTPVETDTPLPSATMDASAKMKSAKILLYEDVSGEYLPRYVKQALDDLNLPYVDVTDHLGDFKEQLLSGTKWDLVISSAEARNVVRGEFFDYIQTELDNGSSAIIEIWTLNSIANGKIAPIMRKCGIKYQSDWFNPPDSERSIWWLAPDNPVLNQPNKGLSLVHPVIYWTGDIGDLIALSSGGDATILGGTVPSRKSDFGTLAVCMKGRLTVQTFSSHDYKESEMIPLWENYIYNALIARFEGN